MRFRTSLQATNLVCAIIKLFKLTAILSTTSTSTAPGPSRSSELGPQQAQVLQLYQQVVRQRFLRAGVFNVEHVVYLFTFSIAQNNVIISK